MEEAEKGDILERNTKPRLDDHPGPTAASLFTDDLILEILSRLPASSVHRFKCVSVPWRDLIADPANRMKLPQTLAGFLYITVHKSGHGHHFATAQQPRSTSPSLTCTIARTRA
ncbi:F-box protein At1g31080-like [Triticum aestivum]|uniref:F-box protein At1g31080-like n=1 Tax=Triticum aestivum TaxID=4565 RepID=UPI001D008294|nr:F-box protein At1g31080-like [Triticum aestivum]